MAKALALGSVLAGLVVLAAILWSSGTTTPCHTVFVLREPVDISVAADAIKESRAVPISTWHRSERTSGGVFTDGMRIEEIVRTYEGVVKERGSTRITAFRLEGILPVESLGSLGSSVQYRLVVHRTAVVTAPYLEGDPPVHVVKTFGTCSARTS